MSGGGKPAVSSSGYGAAAARVPTLRRATYSSSGSSVAMRTPVAGGCLHALKHCRV